MTEDQKVFNYLESKGLDPADAGSQRVIDISEAWMYRSQLDTPPLVVAWDATVAQVMQRLDLGAPTTPEAATSSINAALDTYTNAINEANQMVQTLAVRDEIIKQQQNVLDAMAMILHLPSGSKYIDMIPMMQAMVDSVEGKPTPMPPYQPVQ
jgi:hypothetical protein